MADKYSIVDISSWSEPATMLVKKVSNAVGVLYEPRKIRKRAEAEAEADRIKAILGIELSEIEQRGIERLVHQEARKQENIESITAQAARQLPSDAKTEDLDEDWVAHFFGRCDKVSDKQMQSLWSNLLAGEATKPGTYSKRTVDLVESMDKKDAALFTKFCKFAWVIAEVDPLIFDTKNEIYTKNGINFTALQHLDAIGLISFSPLSSFVTEGHNKQAVIFYYGKPTLVEFANDKDNKISIGHALFTQAGRELVSICGSERSQDFYEYAIEQLSKQELCLSSVLPEKRL